MQTVWIVIYGSGDDGDASVIDAVFDSKGKAEKYIDDTYPGIPKWEREDRHGVEEWPVN
jgi:hypothetical protein